MFGVARNRRLVGCLQRLLRSQRASSHRIQWNVKQQSPFTAGWSQIPFAQPPTATSLRRICSAHQPGDHDTHAKQLKPDTTADRHLKSNAQLDRSMSTLLTLEQVQDHLDVMERWTCTGCGIDLQFHEPKKVGFLPEQVLRNIEEPSQLKHLQCERCHQMTNHGKILDAKLPYQVYEQQLMKLRAKDLLMIQLVDLLDISGSLLPNSRHLFGNKPVMLVVNKGDLIPPVSGIRRLMRHIRSEAKKCGIQNILSIYLISAIKSIGMKEMLQDIHQFRQGRDICVVGAANVGKSTFLNSLLRHLVERKWQHNHRKYWKQSKKTRQLPEIRLEELHNDPELLNIDQDTITQLQLKDIKTSNKEVQEEENDDNDDEEEEEDPEALEACEDEDRRLTTSPLPGTTLAVQSLPVMIQNELCHVLDTPGLIVDRKRQQLVEILALDGAARLRNVFPTTKLPVTTYQMKKGQSLFLGALCRLDYEVVPLSQEELDESLDHDDQESGQANAKQKSHRRFVHKHDKLLFSWNGVLPCHATKTSHADDVFLRHAGGLLSPPRGLDALSFTGPLQYDTTIHLKSYLTEDIRRKSKDTKKAKRTSAVEIELPGFGWLNVAAVDLDGSQAAAKTVAQAKIHVYTCQGLHVQPRKPLFPYELSKSKSSTWK